MIVVEHDKETILSADYIFDIGPGAGIHGGRIVASGTPAEIMNSDNLTGQYLSEKKVIGIPEARRKGNGKHLVLSGARGNNLKNVDLKIPSRQIRLHYRHVGKREIIPDQ